MDFTREPIIETVITPKEGCKLVIRSSKSNSQEEHFVDAVEVVSFGHSFFFRSLERPKTFLVPATDYEILEVREARMVLKNVGIDRTIKIGGGREGQMRTPKEPAAEKMAASSEESSQEEAEAQPAEKLQDGRLDKKRERRRNYRRRRGKDGMGEEEIKEGSSASKIELQEPEVDGETEKSPLAQQVITTSILTSLLPPPPTLISETIGRYKDNILFKDAFYVKEEKAVSDSGEENPEEENSSEVETEQEAAVENAQEVPVIPQPEYGSFEMSEEEEEEVYQRRKEQSKQNEEVEEETPKDDSSEEQEKKDNEL